MNFLLVFLLLASASAFQDDLCPLGCFCDERKGDRLPNNQVGLRVKCVPGADFKFDLTHLPDITSLLDLSKADLTEIRSNYFQHLRYLAKLDLQGNSIATVHDGSFLHLNKLEVLDLSENRLNRIKKNMFLGLNSLQKLKLNDNLIKIIEFGAFDPLVSVQRVDLYGNSLVCDCELSWILDWQQQALNRVRCSSPVEHRDVLLKTLTAEQMVCDVPEHIQHKKIPDQQVTKFTKKLERIHLDPNFPLSLDPSFSVPGQLDPTFSVPGQLDPSFNLPPRHGSNYNINPPFHQTNNKVVDLKMSPNNPQLVVEGDPLRLSCTLPRAAPEAILSWLLDGKPVHNPDVLVSRVNPVLEEGGGTHSNVYISGVRMDQAGQWTCRALLHSGYSEEKSVKVQVMSSGTVLCAAGRTNTSKGTYDWGVTLAGQSSVRDCARGKLHNSKIRRYCDESGYWAGINDTECRHISNVTDKLARFSGMNHSGFDPVTLVQAAEKLLEFTTDSSIFHDPDDVIYLTKTVENYIAFLRGNPRLANILVRIISNILHMKGGLLGRAQEMEHAGSRILTAIYNIAKIVPNFEYQVPDLVVHGASISKRTYEGYSCSWFADNNKEESSLFCSETNETSVIRGKNVVGSVHLPSTLYYQLGLHDRDTSLVKNVVFLGFHTNELFPQDGGTIVTSPVIGANIVNMEPFNLSEPVYIMLENLQLSSKSGQLLPAWWNPRANKGLGGWAPQHCRLMKERTENAVFSCNRLGHYALLFVPDTVERTSLDVPGTHSSVFVGSMIALLGLGTSIFVYILLFNSIRISSKIKHALINLWIAIVFFLVFYSISAELDDPLYCSINVQFVHYFILASVFWMTLTSMLLRRKLVTPVDRRLETENIYGELVPQGEQRILTTPVTGVYMIGWGIPFIIGGISGGASSNQFSRKGECSLPVEVSAASLLAPALVSLALHFYYVISILARSNRYQTRILVSEDRQVSKSSLQTQASILVADSEKSHRIHGGVLCVTTALLLCLFMIAGFTVLTPPETRKESPNYAFHYVFSALSASLGIFVFSFYCVSREDIQRNIRGQKRIAISEEDSNLLSPHQLRHSSPAHHVTRPNNWSPNLVGKRENTCFPPNFSNAASGQAKAMEAAHQMAMPGKPDNFNVYPVKDGGGSVLGYRAPNNSVGASDNDSKNLQGALYNQEYNMYNQQYSMYNQQVNDMNLNIERDKIMGKAVWSQANPEMISFRETSLHQQYRNANTSGVEDYLYNSELSPSLPPPVFSPLPAPWGPAVDGEVAGPTDPDTNATKPPFHSLPRPKKRSKSRDRFGSSRAHQSGLSDQDRLEVASRYSEVSSSVYSSRSNRRGKDKPRRKPRKRSEVLQTGNRYKRSTIKSAQKSTEEDLELAKEPRSSSGARQAPASQSVKPRRRATDFEDLSSDFEELPELGPAQSLEPVTGTQSSSNQAENGASAENVQRQDSQSSMEPISLTDLHSNKETCV